MSHTTRDAVQMAMQGNSKGFQEAINDILTNRVRDALEVKKLEIASNFMTTDVEEEFEISEEVELTEKEDTAMQVAKALKKMGVKSNAKEADVIKKIPDVLKKLGMQQALNMMNKSKDYRNDMLGDILDSLQEESLDKAGN